MLQATGLSFSGDDMIIFQYLETSNMDLESLGLTLSSHTLPCGANMYLLLVHVSTQK